MKKTSKWPSRAFNLLIVLAMVISLSAILVAPPIAAADEACPRAIVYDGCHLDVAVSTYIKNANSTFEPKSIFNPPGVGEITGDCFYVNAVVVNDGNSTAFGNITATLKLPTNVTLDTSEDSLVKVWPGSQGVSDLLSGRMADFWWKVCCTGPGEDQVIRVNVTSSGAEPCLGSDYTLVDQKVTGETKCVEVKIVEAPGLGPVTGRLINTDTGLPVVYDSLMPDTVEPCQNFGIKAEITNLCNGTVTVGNVYINEGWDNAHLVGGDPNPWYIGSLEPGKTAVVAWTLHCDGPGPVLVNVTTPDATVSDIVTYVQDPVTVQQQTPGGLVVVITKPNAEHSCINSTDLTIKQATDQVPSCGAAKFDVRATVTYTGVGIAELVFATISASSTVDPWVTLPVPNSIFLGNLTSMVPVTVDFGNVTCKGEGLGNITVTATSYEPVNPPAPGSDYRTISQQKVIATADPTIYEYGRYENICDPNGFDVSFRYYNWSGIEWPSQGSAGNVTACVEWGTGNVSLVSVEWRKINNPTLVPPQDPDTWATLIPNVDLVNGQACVVIPDVICRCCAFDVRWHFKCTGDKPSSWVTFYGNVTVDEPAFKGGDTSEPVCVIQEWKADLWTDILFFFQNEDGKMIEQDAMVPGNDFHVVIPVMNTGDAEAYNVQVYFTISDIPAAGCAKSYSFKSASGDGHVSFNPVTGVGVATFQYIPGHTAQKVVLLLHCECEGSVRVEIPLDMPDGILGWTKNDPGMQGFDYNTGEGVPVDDIHVPPCPMYFYQVPFTVTIENPETCQTFTSGDIFAVKALIHNGSQSDMTDVYATVSWNLDAAVVLLDPNGNMTKYVGNITAGLDTEITWVLQCSGAGEVYLTVSASSTTPMLTAYSDEVNVHQIQPPEACLSVTILSPDEHQSDNPDNHGHPMIATGQQFAVTAKIANWGTSPAEDVVVTLYPNGCCFFDSVAVNAVDGESSQGRYVSLAPGETGNRTYDTIGNGTFEVATFTLVGGGTSDWGLKDCNVRDAHICVNATTTTNTTCPANDYVEVSIYPAAFLVAQIDSIAPSTTIVLGDEFTVNYTITNYGVADAWNSSVTLSADSKVGLVPGTGGYTQALGTVAGWGWGEPKSVQGSFDLKCTAEGLSTLTLSATGQDECGWQPVLGWKSYEEQVWKHGWVLEEDTNFQWVQLAGSPIYSWFLVSDSETIAQSQTGACPDVTSVNINLKSGWNLVSLPLIPTNSAIATVLAGVSSHVNSVWYYDGAGWLSWSPGVGGSLSTMDQKKAYWISMKADSAQYTLTENGAVGLPPPGLPTTIDVAAGWNMIGFKSTCARTAGSYLSGVPFVRIWSFANGAWSAVQSGDKMQPGLGYWIAATSAGTIYP